MNKIAVILSGGIGSRMGLDLPKQYVEFGGNPIIGFSIKTFLDNEQTDVLVIAVADEWRRYVEKVVSRYQTTKPVLYSKSGETRQYSIYNALKVIREQGYSDEDIVLIHDAARPFVSHELIKKCYEGCLDADGILPVIPVKDTTYLSMDGKHIDSLLDRSKIWHGQAPEAFRFGKYFRAHENLTRNEILKINGSTELAYKTGMDCQMIKGDPMNFKITTQEDLFTFENIINLGLKS